MTPEQEAATIVRACLDTSTLSPLAASAVAARNGRPNSPLLIKVRTKGASIEKDPSRKPIMAFISKQIFVSKFPKNNKYPKNNIPAFQNQNMHSIEIDMEDSADGDMEIVWNTFVQTSPKSLHVIPVVTPTAASRTPPQKQSNRCIVGSKCDDVMLAQDEIELQYLQHHPIRWNTLTHTAATTHSSSPAHNKRKQQIARKRKFALTRNAHRRFATTKYGTVLRPVKSSFFPPANPAIPPPAIPPPPLPVAPRKRITRRSSSSHLSQNFSSSRPLSPLPSNPNAFLHNNSTTATAAPFTFEDFRRIWHTAVTRLGMTSTAQIESGSFLRDANNGPRYNPAAAAFDASASTKPEDEEENEDVVEESSSSSSSLEVVTMTMPKRKRNKRQLSNVQKRAMYGRTKSEGMKNIIEMTNLKPHEIFLDIGHGLGNAVIQASFTIGCESRGIEVVPERCRMAELFRELMMERVEEIGMEESFCRPKIGKIELREGSVTNPQNQSFLTTADVVLVNNSDGIFGVRSGDMEGKPTVDAYVAGIFAQLKPLSRLIAFHPLLGLGRSLEEENERRSMNGMDISTDASFFTVEKRILGKNVVSWSATKTVEVFLYTRVKQSSSSRRENDHANSNGGGGGGSTHGDGTALFLCWNKECFGSTNPTAAVCEKSGLLVESCVYCGSSRAMKTRR